MKPKLVATSEPVDGAAVLAVLDRRLGELNERDRDLLQQIIRLEKSGGDAHGGDASKGVSLVAERLLEGDSFVHPGPPAPSSLELLRAERTAIAKAIALGNDKRNRLFIERAGNVYAVHSGEIASLERRRVLLAAALQGVNQAREDLKEKLLRAGCPGAVFSTDGVELLFLANRHDEVSWAEGRVVADNICTAAEIERARRGGKIDG